MDLSSIGHCTWNSSGHILSQAGVWSTRPKPLIADYIPISRDQRTRVAIDLRESNGFVLLQ
jgi:hypothetical protein